MNSRRPVNSDVRLLMAKHIDGLVAAEIDVESLERKRLRVAQVAWFSSRRLMIGACSVGAIAPLSLKLA
jgi:hypothetical protein